MSLNSGPWAASRGPGRGPGLDDSRDRQIRYHRTRQIRFLADRFGARRRATTESERGREVEKDLAQIMNAEGLLPRWLRRFQLTAETIIRGNIGVQAG